jgi:ATP-dependent RNA helicase DDX46/PRP5
MDADFARLLRSRAMEVFDDMNSSPSATSHVANYSGVEDDELDMFFSALPMDTTAVAAISSQSDSEIEQALPTEIPTRKTYFELIAGSEEKKSAKATLPGYAAGPMERLNPSQLFQTSRSIADMSPTELATLLANSRSRIEGKKAPRPVTTFSHCGLLNEALELLEMQKILKPTAVQMATMPAMLSGRDVLGIAPTGTGKTLGYGLPLVRIAAFFATSRDVLREGNSNPGILGVVLVPTRELGMQVAKVLTPLATIYGLSVISLLGGDATAMKQHIGRIKNRHQCEIVVGTPGRVVDVCGLPGLKTCRPLEKVRVLVLDECDRMLDRGFSKQLESVLSAVSPEGCQKAMFSATLPGVMRGVVSHWLKDSVRVTVSVGEGSNIKQRIEVIPEEPERISRLLELLGEWTTQGTAMVFCESKEKVDELYVKLFDLGWGIGLFSLHSGQDQKDREDAVEMFKLRDKAAVLLSTSVAARGLDCGHVVLVVNFHCPDHIEDYVHRIGRTGRAGKIGFAYTFVDPARDEELAQDLADAVKASGEDVDGMLVELARTYKEKLARGEVTAAKRWKGFQGHGFRQLPAGEVSDEKLRQLLGDDEEHPQSSEAPKAIAAPARQPPQGQPRVAAPAAKSAAPPPPPPPPGLPPGRPTQALALTGPSGPGAGTLVIAPSGSTAGMSVIISKPAAPVRGIPVAPPPAGFIVEELELNEYPTAARLRASAKDVRGPLEDRWGVRLTVKGEFYKKGDKIPPGCRKIFVEIAGKDRQAVRRAKEQLFDTVEDVAIAAFYASKQK